MLEQKVYKNYKELCEALGWKPQTGKSKQLQIKKLGDICNYSRDGNKYIINEIYHHTRNNKLIEGVEEMNKLSLEEQIKMLQQELKKQQELELKVGEVKSPKTKAELLKTIMKNRELQVFISSLSDTSIVCVKTKEGNVISHSPSDVQIIDLRSLHEHFLKADMKYTVKTIDMVEEGNGQVLADFLEYHKLTEYKELLDNMEDKVFELVEQEDIEQIKELVTNIPTEIKRQMATIITNIVFTKKLEPTIDTLLNFNDIFGTNFITQRY